jgi:hypothetical protein
MALKSCKACGRKFPAARKVCSYCGVPHAPSAGGGGVSRGKRNTLVLIAALLVVSVYVNGNRVTGPPPELEALHSSEEAITQCREGIESRLSDQGGEVQGLLEAEYLQGGEYFVRGVVRIAEERNRVNRPVLCEAQFRPEEGWTIEHVEVEF